MSEGLGTCPLIHLAFPLQNIHVHKRSTALLLKRVSLSTTYTAAFAVAELAAYVRALLQYNRHRIDTSLALWGIWESCGLHIASCTKIVRLNDFGRGASRSIWNLERCRHEKVSTDVRIFRLLETGNRFAQRLFVGTHECSTCWLCTPYENPCLIPQAFPFCQPVLCAPCLAARVLFSPLLGCFPLAHVCLQQVDR